MTKKQSTQSKLIKFISGDRFFWLVIALFGVQALWIAFTQKYPMAFDEGYHLGVIKLYANHLSPFWSAQPEHSNVFGAIFRDPSYLYHYLLSFPYRLISALTSSLAVQVITLRLINVAIFGSGLVVFRKLLTVMGSSKALTNITLLIFILIPVTTMLAGQINYDTLLFLITGLLMLWTIQFVSALKSTNKIDAWILSKLFALGLFGILVKYAFLPFFVAAGLVTLTFTIYHYKGRYKELIKDTKKNLASVGTVKKYLLLVLVLVLSVLATERYGVNYVRYNALVPDCSQALSVKECSEFGPWIRDYNLSNRQNGAPMPGPVSYLRHDWLYGMWFRLFFALAGPDNHYQTKGPLTAPAWTFIIVTITGFVAFIIYIRDILRKNGHKVAIPLGLSVFYVLILFANGFASFSETGKPVAINGRYLIPVLLPLMAIGGMAICRLLRTDTAKTVFATIVIVGMLAGGGALTVLIRSEDGWYWNNSTLISVNRSLRGNVGHLVPGYDQPTQYLH